jgi:hypothetical protein
VFEFNKEAEINLKSRLKGIEKKSSETITRALIDLPNHHTTGKPSRISNAGS